MLVRRAFNIWPPSGRIKLCPLPPFPWRPATQEAGPRAASRKCSGRSGRKPRDLAGRQTSPARIRRPPAAGATRPQPTLSPLAYVGHDHCATPAPVACPTSVGAIPISLVQLMHVALPSVSHSIKQMSESQPTNGHFSYYQMLDEHTTNVRDHQLQRARDRRPDRRGANCRKLIGGR